MTAESNYTGWIAILGGAIGAIIAVATPIFRRLGRQDEKMSEQRELIHQMENTHNAKHSKMELEQNAIIAARDREIAELRLELRTLETYVNVWRGVMERELPKILLGSSGAGGGVTKHNELP